MYYHLNFFRTKPVPK